MLSAYTRLAIVLYLTTMAFSTGLVLPAPIGIALAGIFGNRAVIVVEGGPPRTLSPGQVSPEGVRLVNVSSASANAEVEYEGQTMLLTLGRNTVHTNAVSQAPQTITLYADSRGHHFVTGGINGASIEFIVDTGATLVSIGRGDAIRAGIDLSRGVRIAVGTATGMSEAVRVRLDNVRIGSITLYGVEAIVFDNDLPYVLLGQSFLGRTEMIQSGDRLTLRSRF